MLAANQPDFLAAFGLFYRMWSANDITVDYAIGKLLKLPADETHLLTAGIDFNRRASLLRILLNRGTLPRKPQIISALNTIQNESLRNVFAHSFLQSDEITVTFIERTRHGKYDPKKHSSTISTFRAHVHKFVDAAVAFQEYMALGLSYLFAFLTIIKLPGNRRRGSRQRFWCGSHSNTSAHAIPPELSRASDGLVARAPKALSLTMPESLLLRTDEVIG